VQLSSLTTDIAAYTAVFQQAAANATSIFDTFLANPTPILSQIIENQIATFQKIGTELQATGADFVTALTTTVPMALQAAFSDLTMGNVEGALNNLLAATLAPVIALASPNLIEALAMAISNPLQNLGKAIDEIGVVAPTLIVGLLGPVISGLGATGRAIQDVINAIPGGRRPCWTPLSPALP
jgi:hypothetical protein